MNSSYESFDYGEEWNDFGCSPYEPYQIQSFPDIPEQQCNTLNYPPQYYNQDDENDLRTIFSRYEALYSINGTSSGGTTRPQHDDFYVESIGASVDNHMQPTTNEQVYQTLFHRLTTPTDPLDTQSLKPQSPRFDGDLYTSAWIRGEGTEREGWCGFCQMQVTQHKTPLRFCMTVDQCSPRHPLTCALRQVVQTERFRLLVSYSLYSRRLLCHRTATGGTECCAVERCVSRVGGALRRM